MLNPERSQRVNDKELQRNNAINKIKKLSLMSHTSISSELNKIIDIYTNIQFEDRKGIYSIFIKFINKQKNEGDLKSNPFDYRSDISDLVKKYLYGKKNNKGNMEVVDFVSFIVENYDFDFINLLVEKFNINNFHENK